VCLWDQAGNLSRDQTFTVTAAGETTPPTLTALRLDGGATTARDRELDVEIDATDATGIARMCISNTTTCATWQPYQTTFNHTLASGGAGTRTVYVWLEDTLGTQSATPFTDQIEFLVD
jgi:hypothetical protein